MSQRVTDAGFVPEDWTGPIPPLAEAGPDAPALEIDTATRAEVLAGRFETLRLVRIRVASFADGRAFTLARQLRRQGYAGRLRAAGPLIADQYPMARRAGFDEVEIDDAMAARQPEPHWRAQSDWRRSHYQSLLAGAPLPNCSKSV